MLEKTASKDLQDFGAYLNKFAKRQKFFEFVRTSAPDFGNLLNLIVDFSGNKFALKEFFYDINCHPLLLLSQI